MITSESIKELATALAKAQGELPGAKKDVNNTFFKSKYADLASTVEALRASFPKHGLSYVQTIVTTERGGGVETMLMHCSGEWIRGEAFDLPVNKADAQGFGSAVTYARRYSLAAICGVAPEDDDGNAAAAAKPTTTLERIQAAEPGNARRATTDAFASLPADAQQIVREWAIEIIGYVSSGEVPAAVDFIEEKGMDNEEKMALWSQLDSKVRSAITKEKERRRIEAVKQVPMGKPSLAEQA
jgi:hypothetical protein